MQIRIAMMAPDFADGGVLTEHDSRTYLAWSNSLTRTLRELGLKGAVDKPPSLQDYLAARPPHRLVSRHPGLRIEMPQTPTTAAQIPLYAASN